MKQTLSAVTALFLLGAGCDVSEPLSPAPVPTETQSTTEPPGGSGGGSGSGGAPAQAPIRTVEQRNPFGNVAAKGNLLWDGDFEWSSPFADQYGWLYGPPYSFDFTPPTIGAACRSGVKCVTLPTNMGVIGIGVGSTKDPLLVTLFARPEAGACADVDVSLLGASGGSGDVPVAETTDKPDALGWCFYRAAVPAYPRNVYLLVDNHTKGDVIVDDAVVRRAPEEAGGPPPAPPMSPLSLETQLRHDEARAAVLRLRGPHDPPPNAARRAFEEQNR